jgi:predicted Zn-dependent protease
LLARALVALGDIDGARSRLAVVERVAPDSAAGAEAQVTRLALDDPGADRAIQAVARSSRVAPLEDLREIGSRARRLATLHGSWPAWLAAAIADLRRGRWMAARGALEVAIEIAPGAPGPHLELAAVLLELDDATGAQGHAQRAMVLEGESARVLYAVARTLAANKRVDEAQALLVRARSMYPDDAATRSLAESLRNGPARRAWPRRLAAWWRRWRS